MCRRRKTDTSFLEERSDWLKVEALHRPDRTWDVVLVIDGTCSSLAEEWGVDRRTLIRFFAA